jgi:TPR repeat protein
VPIYDFAMANERLADTNMEAYYPCCGKSICVGCDYSFRESGNIEKCPFCNSNRNKTGGERVQEIMKRAEANDPTSTDLLANYYYHGSEGLIQDHAKAMELFTRAAKLGFSKAHYNLGLLYHEWGNMKKAKFHNEAAAMAGNEGARYYLGNLEAKSGNMEQAIKHWTIAASAGDYFAMHNLLIALKKRDVSRESIDSTLIAYNNACAEMRSDARDTLMDNN